MLQIINEKCQDYVKGEYQNTKWKIKHYLRQKTE